MTSIEAKEIVHPFNLVEAKVIAELLNCAVSTVYHLANDGHIPCVKLGTHYRFDYEPIVEWVRQGGTANGSAKMNTPRA